MPKARTRRLALKTSEQLENMASENLDNFEVIKELVLELLFRSSEKDDLLYEFLIEYIHEERLGYFSWPSTNASPTGKSEKFTIPAPDVGVLKIMGYHVGMSGEDKAVRRILLDNVFNRRLPPVHSFSYTKEWGQPTSRTRLKKLADTIAACARNQKRMNNGSRGKAIQDWEMDLKYLHRKYYKGKFDGEPFWPTTRDPNASLSWLELE